MQLKCIKAILFDLDGTLVDSSEAIIKAIEKVLKSTLFHDIFDSHNKQIWNNANIGLKYRS